MTDEDDRMDRARRIRRMREGRRDGEESNGDDPEPTTDEEETPPSPNGNGSEEEWFEDEQAGLGDGGVPEDADHAGDGDSEADRSTADAETGESVSDADDSDGAADAAADPESAAVEAAAAAAEFEGGGTDDEPTDQIGAADDESGDTRTATESDPADGDSADGGDVDPESAAVEAAAAAAEFEGVEGASEPDTTLEELEAAADAAQADLEDGESDGTDESGTADDDSVPATPGVDGAAETETETRVLEFELGGERYCIAIDYVEEIVKKDHVTRVPNTPSFVRGVVDLRGQITTILDPKESIGIDSAGAEELIVVFDGETFEDQGHIGWLVDEVRQVTPITESEVKESPVDKQHVNGVVERDDEFVIWIDPDIALVGAEDDE
jgi:purine-binding chemotaxis protein CheW